MSKKLLLADDSITIQKVIQITFAHEDYELTITDNGDAALVKAREIKPDLIMTDIYMPGKNGYELTSAIKQDPALRHVPVLLLVGSFEPFDEDKARSCNADAWIEKPFESQSLIDKVAELLNAARPAAEIPAPVAEPEPFAAVEPAGVADDAAFEMPVTAFDVSVSAEPDIAASVEDPFADISFEEEVPVAEPEIEPELEAESAAVADEWSDFAVTDDWSDVAEEPATTAPVAEDAFAIADDFNFAEDADTEVIDNFGYTEEASATADDFASVKEVPFAETAFDDFEMDDDEIMSLGDEDILGEEDLEPIMPEQTLAAWSRDEAAVEDIFAGPLEEEPAFESEPDFATPVEPASAEEAPVFFDDEPVAGETPFSPVPVAAPAPVEESAPVVEKPEPAAAAASIEKFEAQASALSEEDVEKIIEKIVTRVVENLAGSILERVAWEVVPDLAENLIREEIRKIKDAAA
ncbi:MAG: response regulator [Desulfuromonadales bacterium]|nr:response regulator [Desulfuromonadales bacterium]